MGNIKPNRRGLCSMLDATLDPTTSRGTCYCGTVTDWTTTVGL